MAGRYDAILVPGECTGRRYGFWDLVLWFMAGNAFGVSVLRWLLEGVAK